MPRASTAEAHDFLCPLCGKELARDLDGKGWVRHRERPDVENLQGRPDYQTLTTAEERDYLRLTGLCPFERGQKDPVIPPPPRFLHLESRRGSRYRQLFLKDQGIRAESIYRETVGPNARTPEQVADAYHVPVEAVREAIEYCEHNEDLLRQERDEDWAAARSRGFGAGRLNPSELGADVS